MVSSINNTDHHNITKIHVLLKVVLTLQLFHENDHVPNQILPEFSILF